MRLRHLRHIGDAKRAARRIVRRGDGGGLLFRLVNGVADEPARESADSSANQGARAGMARRTTDDCARAGADETAGARTLFGVVHGAAAAGQQSRDEDDAAESLNVLHGLTPAQGPIASNANQRRWARAKLMQFGQGNMRKHSCRVKIILTEVHSCNRAYPMMTGLQEHADPVGPDSKAATC